MKLLRIKKKRKFKKKENFKKKNIKSKINSGDIIINKLNNNNLKNKNIKKLLSQKFKNINSTTWKEDGKKYKFIGNKNNLNIKINEIKRLKSLNKDDFINKNDTKIVNSFYDDLINNKKISDYIREVIDLSDQAKPSAQNKIRNLLNNNFEDFINDLITITINYENKVINKVIVTNTLTQNKLNKYFPDNVKTGGSRNSNKNLFKFYENNLIKNNKIIIDKVSNLFDENLNHISETRKLKSKKYDFEDEFKILKDDLNTNKNIFDLKSTLELYINNIDETINNYKENLNELNLEQKKYSEKIKKKNNIERDINKIKINESKSKRNLDSSENILRSNLSLTGSDPITDAKLRSKLREINKEYERRSVQNNYSDWSRKKKAYQQIINSLNEKKLLMNSIENNEKELKSINKEIKNIQKKIEELDKEKKKLILQKDKNNKTYSINNIKSDFISYFDKIIQISRDINELIQDMHKNNKQDIYNFYFKKDEKLNNLINKLGEAFGVNNIININNTSININIPKKNNNPNIPDNQTVYKILKGENKKFEIISDTLKSYTKKMKNNNLNKKNIKSNTKKKLENIINPRSSSESQINNQSNNSDSGNMLGGRLGLIDDISDYIDHLESKNININNELFFLRIMKDFDNYTLDDETKMYFENTKENHLNITNKLRDKIDNLNIYRTNKLENDSLKKRFNDELKYFKNELNKMDEKYSKLNSKKYKSSKTVYVYTYTDNLKLYFIILNLLELYISNY